MQSGFTNAGAKKFEAITATNIGHQLAIVFRSQVLSAPVIQSAIPGGQCQVDGAMTADEVNEIVDYLNRTTTASDQTGSSPRPAIESCHSDPVLNFWLVGWIWIPERPEMEEGLTSDHQALSVDLWALSPYGGTDVDGALFEAATYLGRMAPESRRAVILVSDNEPSEEQTSDVPQVVRAAQQSGTPIYSIKVGFLQHSRTCSS